MHISVSFKREKVEALLFATDGSKPEGGSQEPIPYSTRILKKQNARSDVTVDNGIYI
jgi:hypothetical protein